MGFSDIFRVNQFKLEITRLNAANIQLQNRIQELLYLEKYKSVADLDAYAENAKLQASNALNNAQTQAATIISKAQADATVILETANSQSREITQGANKLLSEAQNKADRIISEANTKADVIAHDALEAQRNIAENRKLLDALKNTIEGYSDAYIIPSYSLLDELAAEFGYAEAGEKLKEARNVSKAMIREKRAAICDYVETIRKETAIRFVIDAFNGKVDSILSRTKQDNFGKQKQAIEDAYALVNANGKAFRNAQITPEYLAARLEELKWACTAQELKRRQQDEQRELRERMREEERARKEYEKAQRDAAKEEEYYRKAMAKARAEMESVSDELRAEYEAKILDFEKKLKEAEEKNQRALSMAQQTRAGNVYVISNIGSFGEDVFKVGMTRRLNPEDRVRELGDASVPFPFDIHGIVYSTDAPTLEKELHHALLLAQMNKANPRKEFFKTSLHEIKRLVETKGYNVNWSMVADALEFKETIKIEQQIAENPAVRAEWEGAMAKASEQADELEDEIA